MTVVLIAIFLYPLTTLQDVSFRPPSDVLGYLEMIPELFIVTRRMEVESCEAAGRGGW